MIGKRNDKLRKTHRDASVVSEQRNLEEKNLLYHDRKYCHCLYLYNLYASKGIAQYS